MTIILDNYTVPKQGRVNLNVQLAFDLHVSAEQAKQNAKQWVREEISMFLTARQPTLVIGEQIVWRTPIEITLPHQGTFPIATLDVDVLTGTILEPAKTKTSLIATLEQNVKPQLSRQAFSLQPYPTDYIDSLSPRPQFVA